MWRRLLKVEEVEGVEFGISSGLSCARYLDRLIV